MHFAHLSLTNFRNYVRLEFELPPGTLLLRGDNAQGKTNLLEAFFFAATTKSPRTGSDRELINWLALREAQPFARVVAQVRRARGPLKAEVTIAPRENEDRLGAAAAGNGASRATKRIRLNGANRRAIDLIGQINVVMFSPQDIELVNGAPASRRRYLDITNAQVDPRYVRALQQYQRIILQRNHLLRHIRDRRSGLDQLTYWNHQLIEAGAYIVLQRHRMVAVLNELMREIHPSLTGSEERLRVVYASTLAEDGARTSHGRATADEPPEASSLLASSVAEPFRRRLAEMQSREVAAGLSLVGPHRDDLQFFLDGTDLTPYGSRGQQRIVALALKLAEAEFMRRETGERPVLLLDDVMSELDARRRSHVLSSIGRGQQVIITTTDLDYYDPAFLANATLCEVSQGRLEPVTPRP